MKGPAGVLLGPKHAFIWMNRADDGREKGDPSCSTPDDGLGVVDCLSTYAYLPTPALAEGLGAANKSAMHDRETCRFRSPRGHSIVAFLLGLRQLLAQTWP